MEENISVLRLLYSTPEIRKIVLTWEPDHFVIHQNNRLSFTVDSLNYRGLISIIPINDDNFNILFHETGKVVKSISEKAVIEQVHRMLTGT